MAILRKRNSGVPQNLVGVGRVYSFYRYQARNRGIYFELSKVEFQELIQRDCIYCGEPPRNKQKLRYGKIFYYQGIDRVLNAEGYTLENSVPCCAKCNAIKSDILSPKEMLAAMRAIKKVR